MTATESYFVRHHRATRIIHWATVAATVLGVLAVLLREYLESRTLKMSLLTFHQTMGLCVLALALTRIALYWPLGVSKINAFLPSKVRLLSSLGHISLYLSLLAVPLLGWALTSARGQIAYFAWLVPVPGLIERDRDLADSVQDWHILGAWILLIIIALHVGAALFHHFVVKDTVLKSMLPPRKPSLVSAVDGDATEIATKDVFQ